MLNNYIGLDSQKCVHSLVYMLDASPDFDHYEPAQLSREYTQSAIIDPIHAAAMTDKKRGLACRFTANLRVST